MFCARCGTPITGPGAACADCGLDLFQAGAVRLTDPLGDGHWAADRERIVRPAPPADPAPHAPGRADPASHAPAPPADPASHAPAPPADPASHAPGRADPASAEDAAILPNPTAVDASASGDAPAVDGFLVGRDDSQHESSIFILGGEDRDAPSWLPWVVVTMVGLAFLAVVGVTSAVLDVADISGPASATPTTTASTASPTPAATSPRPTPSTTASSRTPSPSTPKARPSFPANATICSRSLAASKNASCGLAEAVAAEIAENPRATRITATSPVSGKSFRFECLTDVLIICKVANITVYVTAD